MGRTATDQVYNIWLPEAYPRQREFIDSPAKRKVIRAGRRGGKTTGMAIYAAEKFLEGHRVLYAAPTDDQIDTFWRHIKEVFEPLVTDGVYYKNETKHIIQGEGIQRIRAKTAFNADTLRGDYADILILDEFQLMNEDTWNTVGAPMMLDSNGTTVFIYTPPSLQSRSRSKADDPQHAAKMFRRAQKDTTGRWATFSFSSHENPFISKEALEDITQDMTAIAYRMEIMAEDIDEAPGALWTRKIIEDGRTLSHPDLQRVVVAIDPSATSTGDEAGVVTAGSFGKEMFLLEDNSVQGSPTEWARAAIAAYHRHKADRIIAEGNNGGEMVSLTIKTIDPSVPVRLVHASRGKQTRAEPISAIYEQGRGHHVGSFPQLEDELCLWQPGMANSPNRLDALVWAMTDLMQHPPRRQASTASGF